MYLKEILPFYLLVTKGYGFTVDDINQSCPTDLQPYIDAYELQKESDDEANWIMGMYVADSIMSSIGNSQWFRGKNGKIHSYTNKPFLQKIEKSKASEELSEEEKQRQVDLFFAREKARRVNWKRNHKSRD